MPSNQKRLVRYRSKAENLANFEVKRICEGFRRVPHHQKQRNY